MDVSGGGWSDLRWCLFLGKGNVFAGAPLDAEAVLANFRACLEKINSPGVVEDYLRSGFFTLMRDEGRAPAETLRLLEQHFQLN